MSGRDSAQSIILPMCDNLLPVREAAGCPHFMEDKTEGQRGQVTRSHMRSVAALGPEPRSL